MDSGQNLIDEHCDKSSPFYPLRKLSNWRLCLARCRPLALVVPTTSQIPCMQDRQAKAHVVTTDRIQLPARALHRQHACCRVLDIWQAGQLQRQATGPIWCTPSGCQPCSSNIADSRLLAGPHSFLDAFADMATIVSGSPHRTSVCASTTRDGLIFVAINSHDQEFKFRTLRVLCHVTLTMYFLTDLEPSRCRRSLAVPATNVATLATTPRFALQLSASATTASSLDTSRTSALFPGRLRPNSATTVKDWVTFRPTAQPCG